MPGSSLPSSSSSEAPPPVDTCVTLSSVSYFLHAVAVSPPPMTADPQDGQVTSTFCFKFSGEDVDGKWKEKETKMVFRHDAPKKRRGDMELKLTKLKAALEEKRRRWS